MLELARKEDFEAVNAIAKQVHDLHVAWRPDLYCHTEQPIPIALFEDCIRNRTLFTAKLSGNVVGIVRFEIRTVGGDGSTTRKVMRIDNIAVEESLRNHGIGKAMVEDVHALAKVNRCDEIILSVYPENDGAVAFYQKCSFTIRNIGMQMKL